MVYDAVRVRLIEIGEAVKGIDPALLGRAPAVPWKEIARMRDQLAHRYFDTDHAIVQDVVEHDLGAACRGGAFTDRAHRSGRRFDLTVLENHLVRLQPSGAGIGDIDTGVFSAG